MQEFRISRDRSSHRPSEATFRSRKASVAASAADGARSIEAAPRDSRGAANRSGSGRPKLRAGTTSDARDSARRSNDGRAALLPASGEKADCGGTLCTTRVSRALRLRETMHSMRTASGPSGDSCGVFPSSFGVSITPTRHGLLRSSNGPHASGSPAQQRLTHQTVAGGRARAARSIGWSGTSAQAPSNGTTLGAEAGALAKLPHA